MGREGRTRRERPPAAAGRWSPNGWPGRLASILLLAAVYYMAARLSLRLSLIERNVTPLWPPTGIAVVAFLLLGRRVWPAIAVAAFVVNEPISTSWLAAAATAAGNTLAPFVAAELLRAVGLRTEIDRLRDAVAIVFLAALGSMLISASVGAGTLVASGAIPGRQFLSAWAVWWTGDAMGVLVVAPFLLSLLLFRQRSGMSWARRVEAATLFAGLTVLSLAVAHSKLHLLFVVLPFMGWAAWRFQQRGAAPAALLASGIATWAAARGLGPFAQGTLFGKMLTLQAFNATVAFTSFVFAAVVTERLRAREALERGAAELEGRVRRRTSELSEANEHLRREIAERKDAERRLRQREGQLSEAQQMARVGSWEWLMPDDRVAWSDEMYRIHGYAPREFPVSLDRAIELVVPEDLGGIRGRLAAALAAGTDHDLAPVEYRIVRPDGAQRVLRAKSRVTFGPNGRPLRMVGTVQDVTEDKRAEREHRISETLQRSLLPERLPDIPGVLLAARYVPATADVEVGGDWYDVVQLPNGEVGVAIGDVAGHGLRAASTMGQLRMALRAYALEDLSPAAVLGRLHHLVEKLLPNEMATLVYLVFDPESGSITFSNAGHPPPLMVGADGRGSYLEEALAPPLGAAGLAGEFVEWRSEIPPGGTLVLFTDGLVERRGVSLRRGLARLREAATAEPDLDALCQGLLTALVEGEVDDDIALLALRPVPLSRDRLHLRVPAEPQALAPLRRTLRRWLGGIDAEPQEAHDILVACGEACANAIQHPYGAGEGFVDIDLSMREDLVEIAVGDSGRWRPHSGTEGGRGLHVMEGLMDAVEVDSGPAGTVVRMRRRLRAGATHE